MLRVVTFPTARATPTLKCMSRTAEQQRSIAEWRSAYLQGGLPTRISDEHRLEVVTDDWTTVLIVPALLARPLFERSPSMGPVLVRPSRRGLAERWRFFVWLDQAPDDADIAVLQSAGVCLPQTGTPIWLPTSTKQTQSDSWWARWPGKDLPTMSDLVEGTLTVLAVPMPDRATVASFAPSEPKAS